LTDSDLFHKDQCSHQWPHCQPLLPYRSRKTSRGSHENFPGSGPARAYNRKGSARAACPNPKEIPRMNPRPAVLPFLKLRLRARLVQTVLLLTLALGWAGAAAAQTPLGATIVGSSVQFALFSANATRVEVWTFATATASTPLNRYTLTQTDTVNHIWTVTVSGLGAGTLYGLRAWGPNWPYNASWTAGSSLGFVSHVDTNGNRFNPNKLLTDPYAKAVTGEPQRVADGSGNYHYSTAILGGTSTYANVDSAGAMPKSIVI